MAWHVVQRSGPVGRERVCVRAHDDERTTVGHFTVFHVALSMLTD